MLSACDKSNSKAFLLTTVVLEILSCQPFSPKKDKT